MYDISLNFMKLRLNKKISITRIISVNRFLKFPIIGII